LLGTLTFGSDASLTFTPVPEPTTASLLAGAGLLVMLMNRKFARKV
jgi:hypothetical protein